MKQLVVACLFAVVACTVAEPEPALDEVESASTPVEGQGQDWQGQDWQGQDWQGTDPQGQDWQGVRWEGVSLTGVSINSLAVTEASVSRTTLTVWRSLGKLGWQQRLPDRTCMWNSDRTQRLSCTIVDLRVAPSPLAGTNWIGTFRRPNGTTFQRKIRIGASSSEIGAVRHDDKAAMHPLTAHSAATNACPLEPCDNPAGCRVNCDLWLYRITFPDWLDSSGQPRDICGAGQAAMPFSGTWNSLGTFVASTTKFTFGCTTGVITKCARWGYRPFGTAKPTPSATSKLLSPYHQTCVRAASADYCGKRHSFTKNGTLVDVYDNDFIPSTRDLFPNVTALAWESGFSPEGGFQMDHLRYQEIASQGGENVEDVCPGRFAHASDDVPCPSQSQTCLVSTVGWSAPAIWVDSARACAHTEQTVGKWLNRECASCVRQVYSYCSNPADPRGWDAGCVSRAASVCGTNTMAVHSECTTGAHLDKYDSGCTLAVCLDPAHADCCSATGQWSAACVAAADEKCTGGREGYYRIGLHDVWFGFCGGPVVDPLPNTF
jgi:hypothetical protein